MRSFGLAAAVLMGCAMALAQPRLEPLTTLGAIHQLTNAQADHHLPVDFEATVTYIRAHDGTLFVQDGDAAIYVSLQSGQRFVPGDRIRIKGTTRKSYRPIVIPDSLTLIRHGAPLKPTVATFDDLIHSRVDGRLVTLRARLLSADSDYSPVQSTTLQLLTEGGPVEALVGGNDFGRLSELLDAEIEITGTASGLFDGKMQMTGVLIQAQDPGAVKIIHPPTGSPWSQPVTPMDEILSAYSIQSQTGRVRVAGTVTYAQPGMAVVLQNGERSLWVDTKTRADIKIGDVAEASGFPDVHDGFLTLTKSEIQDSHVQAPLAPVAVTPRDLAQSLHVFDLVSVEAKVVAQVREGVQDEYVLVSGRYMFPAQVRYSSPLGSSTPPPMKQIPLGSTVRVTGICIQEDSNPFNVDVPFHLLMRSFDDIVVVASPSWVSVRNLARLAALLLLAVFCVGAWGWMLRRKVRQQTAALAARIETEAAMERRNAQIEQRRSRILEDINGSRLLAEVLEEITELVSFHLNGAPCWCEVTDRMVIGQCPTDTGDRRVLREEIPARIGPVLGYLFAIPGPETEPGSPEHQALFLGTRLATLAIETRRLYSDLVHRSEFDLLTDSHNRFSLDRQIDALIGRSRAEASIFGLIYIDLDDFKRVNDLYGHQVGDLYLQEVTARMKRQLRANDTLARLGGDEFAALIPEARSRADVEEIATRLEQCYRQPFRLEGHVLRGTASIGVAIYPEDATGKSALLKAADASMYRQKRLRTHGGRSSSAEQQRECTPQKVW